MDADALLAAVLARPDDDTPRLAFADWLDEHGQGERAEFIRVQCRLARPPWNSRDMVREAELLTASRYLVPGGRAGSVGEAWLAPEIMKAITPPAGSHSYWRRGFLDSLSCTAADWLAVAPKLHWHPAATDPCPGCGGTGWIELSGSSGDWPCRECPPKHEGFKGGVGRVPRPVPPTAQSVTKVVLTTWPEWDAGVGSNRRLRSPDLRFRWRKSADLFPHRETVGRGASPAMTVAALLAAEWPGITFTLPS